MVKSNRIRQQTHAPCQSTKPRRTCSEIRNTQPTDSACATAAVTYALQNILSQGDHIVAADNLYGGSFNLITHTLATQGITNTIVNVNNLEALEAAIQPNTKVVYAETFGNPNSDVTDIEACCEFLNSPISKPSRKWHTATTFR